MKNYCLDTSVLVHWFDWKKSGVNSIGQKFDFLIKRLQKEKAHLILPSPALAEILAAFKDAPSMIRAEDELSQTLEIKPFDVKCAHYAALMFVKEKEDGMIEAGIKQKVKVDLQIISIVKASGAEILYSEDDKLLKLASRNEVRASRIPDLDPSQESIFSLQQ